MDSDAVPEPFDADELEAAAGEFDVEAARLAELVTDHQALMQRLPGVENLVYEWRKQFDAPVLVRSERWYFVAAPEWTWDEFADDLDATATEMDALASIHTSTVASRFDGSATTSETMTPIVLLRE